MFAKCCIVLLAIALTTVCTAVRADEIKWRADYAAARDEAAAKKLPLVIEITADFCSWCRKLESTTLSDPTVVTMVNQKFVAFKVHREQNGWLADSLGVTGYPTMLLAAPNGRIVIWQEGYVDSTTFQRQLQQMLAPEDGRQDTAIRPASN